MPATTSLLGHEAASYTSRSAPPVNWFGDRRRSGGGKARGLPISCGTPTTPLAAGADSRGDVSAKKEPSLRGEVRVSGSCAPRGGAVSKLAQPGTPCELWKGDAPHAEMHFASAAEDDDTCCSRRMAPSKKPASFPLIVSWSATLLKVSSCCAGLIPAARWRYRFTLRTVRSWTSPCITSLYL